MVAGETSGDLLGGLLLGGLRQHWPALTAGGIGGTQMRAQGFSAWWSSDKLAVRGYVEVLRHYREILGIRKQLATRLLAPAPSERVDLFIGVDVAAAHAAGDFISLVQIHLNPSNGGIDRDFNAIVLFNVPVSFARRLAIAIDGFDGDTAYKGRVRRLDVATSVTDFRFKNNWQEAGESQDSMVTVAYFFDQLPLPQSYQTYQ